MLGTRRQKPGERKQKMAAVKSKDIHKMSKEEKEKRIKELKLELIKASKSGSSKIKEIKRTIAKLLTLNK
jgi:ribosomal protein L29